MWIVVLEDVKVGKVGLRGISKGFGVCCLEEGGFGSDLVVIFKFMMGLGIKDVCFVIVIFFFEDRREN